MMIPQLPLTNPKPLFAVHTIHPSTHPFVALHGNHALYERQGHSLVLPSHYHTIIILLCICIEIHTPTQIGMRGEGSLRYIITIARTARAGTDGSQCTHHMLVWGTVNPDGEKDSHTGLLLRERDIADLAQSGSIVGKPVKIEHDGADVGRVVHAWQHGQRLDCLLLLDNDTARSLFARSFVRNGKTPELSLGYQVTMHQSAQGELLGGRKEVLEVSLVKKGARHNCLVRGYTTPSASGQSGGAPIKNG